MTMTIIAFCFFLQIIIVLVLLSRVVVVILAFLVSYVRLAPDGRVPPFDQLSAAHIKIGADSV